MLRNIRNRIRLRQILQIQKIEQAKAEEINHAKLQFFTNITHELLTPLSIISASVDELKQVAPTYQEQYGVITNNITRLIRLLQQILEFRKSESGNLKLRVSQGDLSAFVRRSVEAFRPLLKKRICISVSIATPRRSLPGLILTNWTRYSITFSPMPPNTADRMEQYRSI